MPRSPIDRHPDRGVEDQLQRLERAGWNVTLDHRLDVYRIVCKARTEPMRLEIKRIATQEVRDRLAKFLGRHAQRHPDE